MAADRPDPRGARWTDLAGEAKSSTYDARWEQLAAAGVPVHGEADLVEGLVEGDRPLGAPPTVLDAGCGTGRVAIELAHRGLTTIGADRDPDLLDAARAKAPELRWVEADLVDLGTHVEPGSVDLAVLAGNVFLFVDPGTAGEVLAAVAATVRPGGLVVAGFQVRVTLPPGGRASYAPQDLDRDGADLGLRLVHRWSSWDRDPYEHLTIGSDYQVSVHVVDAVPAG